MSAEFSARSVSETDKVDKVRALQRVLYRSAKQQSHRRFHALYDKVARSDILWRAWVDVANNQGAPGVDGVTITSIADGDVVGVRAFLDGLAAQLRDKTYRPQPLRRVHIPKPGQPGVTRPLGIPCVADRVVMTAAKIVLEPIFEADFSPVSFGFRPKRSAHQALEAIRVSANRGADWVLDADIKACFDEIDHDALMGQVERRVVDGEMLKLVRCWLRAGVFEGGLVSDSETGTPQGSPISPLLANIALHVLDEAWAATAGLGTLVRYADDFVVLTTSRSRAEEARRRIETVLAGLGLRLHPDKTRIVFLGGGEDGFDFLGFHHRKTPSKFGDRRYLSKWPSTRAMASVRAKVRERTDRRSASRDLHTVVADLNPVLRGWGAYFRYGNSNRKFAAIDSYVHERMAKLASVKYATRYRLTASRFNYGWLTGLGVYRLTGSVRRWSTAHA
jgi:group II intron reverse transcriptase/maturase